MVAFALKQSPIRTWLRLAIRLALLPVLLVAADVHADELRCVDTNGEATYTANRALCLSGETTSLNVDAGSKSGSVDKSKVGINSCGCFSWLQY